MSLVGELNDLGLGDIFQILALSQRTGVLVVTTPVGMGQVLFADGLVVGGAVSSAPQAVGDYLLDQGALTADQLQALVRAERQSSGAAGMPSARGEALAPMQAALEQYLRDSMASLLQATQGSFNFCAEAAVDPWQHFSLEGRFGVCSRGLQAQYLAMEAVRLQDERRMGPGPAVPCHTAASSRPQQLAQALRGDDDAAHVADCDWSTLGQEDSATATPQAAPAPLAALRDALRLLRAASEPTPRWQALAQALALDCERGMVLVPEGPTWRCVASFGTDAAEGRAVTQAMAPPLARAEGDVLAQVWHAQAPSLGTLGPCQAHRALLAALGGTLDTRPVLVAPWAEAGEPKALLVGDNPSGQPLTDAPAVDIVRAHFDGLGSSA